MNMHKFVECASGFDPPCLRISPQLFVNGELIGGSDIVVELHQKGELSAVLEQAKNYLIESERTKMLNMYSLTHYDNLMRSLTVNYHK